MNVDLLIKENKELSEEKQRYKEMWFLANDSLSKYKNLEEKLGCPLDVFVKLLFEQKIWIEVDDEMYLTEYIDFNTELELQEDETWINTLEDYNETEFWAWYMDYRRFSDHLVLRLKDYKKTWWLKKDRSE